MRSRLSSLRWSVTLAAVAGAYSCSDGEVEPKMGDEAPALRGGYAPKPAAVLEGQYEFAYSDPLFDEVFVDIDEMRQEPVPHRYVHGGFEGTDARFSIYFPPPDQYQGRFFQYIMPVSGNEHAVTRPEYPDPSYSVGFAVDSGAYLLESNLGSVGFLPTDDPEITLWRTSAAVAEHSRRLANDYYPEFGAHRPFGYAWGGSGGAFKTIACIESTDGVWDGVVPFIHASPVALPNNFTVQAHAMRLLRDKVPSIVDAVDPGGSADPYEGLDEQQKAALDEVTKFGFPADAWFNYDAIAFGYTGVLASLLEAVILLDGSYFDDFWSEPGYLGADSPQLLEPYRVKHETTIEEVLLPADLKALELPLSLSASQPSNADVPAGFVMAELPKGDLQGATVTVKSGAAAGTVVTIAGLFDEVLSVGYGSGGATLGAVQPGDAVEIDNSIYLAIQTYHRHQVAPTEYPVYAQYRDESGDPLYPQRSFQIGGLFNQSGMMSGSFDGKMIVVENLMDEIAFPWHADWYRARVQAALGDRFRDSYRLWYTEKAMHTPPRITSRGPRPAITTRAVNFGPVLQQALRDLAAWVEDGVAPPDSTAYRVEDGQVVVPETAAQRKGVQPVVTARANGGVRAVVEVGEEVLFSAVVEAPEGAGSVVAVEWDFEGDGDFPMEQELADTTRRRVEVETTYRFPAAGTYFPAVRGSLHREGDASSPYARIQNLGRVRVVVR